MSKNKGFLTIESIFYIIILIIITTLFSIIVVYATNIKLNHDIKINQQINKLRTSIIKYQYTTAINPKYIEFDYATRIKIDEKQVYETPGYLPYLQNINNGSFKSVDDCVLLSFKYQNKDYEYVIFYQK